jgi:hypothetical protein
MEDLLDCRECGFHQLPERVDDRWISCTNCKTKYRRPIRVSGKRLLSPFYLNSRSSRRRCGKR